MIDLDISFVYQIVNFIIIILVLNFLLFRPIRDVIQKRRDLMADQADKIETFTEQATVKVKDYEAALTDARKEGVAVRNGFKDEGSAEEHKIMATAGEEAASTLKGAQAEVSSQVKSAMDQLKKEVEVFAKKATDKVLGQA